MDNHAHSKRPLMIGAALIGLIALTGASTPTRAQEAPQALGDQPDPRTTVASLGAGSALNSPIPGGQVQPQIEDPVAIPSLEAMMAVRPGYTPDHEKSSAHNAAVRQAAWRYGAQNGLAAENQVIRLLLNRRSRQLDEVFDFRSLVLPVGDSDILMIPPVISESDANFAISENGDSARVTGRIDEIIRPENYVKVPPTWRTYLDREVTVAQPPTDAVRPQVEAEVAVWRQGVADGFAAGMRQSTETFMSDLNRLQRDIMGMARYRMLLAAGKVHPPNIDIIRAAASGGRNKLLIDDQQLHIRDHAGLDANARHWTGQ
ncbi:type IV secretory system conjugative DNA transfer family protein [Asaia bogorensis]|nr:type IV secretory system conjugative DNA transfer family protein [Asaia bogorensis]